MANSIKVKVLDKKTLELSENANVGDYIELDKIESLDTGYISSLIEKEKEILLRKRVEEEVKKKEQELNSQKEAALAKQKVELLEENNKKIEELKENLANQKLNYEKQISKNEKNYKDEINKLTNENERIRANFDSSVANKEKELENKFLKEKNEIDRSYLEEKEKFKSQIVELEIEKKNLIETKEKDIQIEIDKVTSKFNEEKDKLKRDYDEKIAKLTRDKSVLNSKNIGEDLEVWCDREIRQYMQNGFLNCSWEKDNTVIKNEGENKGSKADFIFKIYADEEKTDANFLTSVCLEMKDENPDLTVISITHEIDEAYRSDEVVVLNDGKIFMQGTPKEVFAHYKELATIGLDIPFYDKLALELDKYEIDIHDVNSLGGLVEKLCQSN